MDLQSLINVAIFVKDGVETVAQIKDTVQNTPKLAEVGFVEFIKMKYGVIVTEKNIEQLFHIVKKIAMTSQIKTKDFLVNILQKHQEGDIEISMATLRVIEYMDDELLEALYNIQNLKLFNENQYLKELYTEYAKTYQTLLLHNLANTHIGGNISQAISRQSKAVPPVVREILELIKLTEC